MELDFVLASEVGVGLWGRDEGREVSWVGEGGLGLGY